MKISEKIRKLKQLVTENLLEDEDGSYEWVMIGLEYIEEADEWHATPMWEGAGDGVANYIDSIEEGVIFGVGPTLAKALNNLEDSILYHKTIYENSDKEAERKTTHTTASICGQITAIRSFGDSCIFFDVAQSPVRVKCVKKNMSNENFSIAKNIKLGNCISFRGKLDQHKGNFKPILEAAFID